MDWSNILDLISFNLCFPFSRSLFYRNASLRKALSSFPHLPLRSVKGQPDPVHFVTHSLSLSLMVHGGRSSKASTPRLAVGRKQPPIPLGSRSRCYLSRANRGSPGRTPAPGFTGPSLKAASAQSRLCPSTRGRRSVAQRRRCSAQSFTVVSSKPWGLPFP